MSDEKFLDKYRIKTSRYIMHNYGMGQYFVTICTHNRQEFFGQIIKTENQDFEMHLSEIGQFLNKVINEVNEHNSYAYIPIYTIMPNHVHLIVIITTGDSPQLIHAELPGLRGEMQKMSQNKGNLPVTIGNIKSSVTKYANEHHIPFAWQTRFHDHIIRSQFEMNDCVTYIERNVFNWAIDPYHTKAH